MTKFSRIKPLITQENNVVLGIKFHQETVCFNKRFTNLYYLKINTQKYSFALKAYPQPKPLIDYKLTGHKIIAGINFAGFYLSDEKTKPKNIFYNLLFYKNQLLQFPTNDRTAVLIKNGKLNHKKINSNGTVKIGEQNFSWSGSYANNKASDLIAYGPFNIDITKQKFNSLTKRQIQPNSNFITCPQDHLLLGCYQNHIKAISSKKLNLIQYSFVLKGSKNTLKNITIGDKIEDLKVSNHKFPLGEDICSASFLLAKTKSKLITNLKKELVYPKKQTSQTSRKRLSQILERYS